MEAIEDSRIEIIRVGKLAKLLGVSRTTLWRLEKEGKLPPRYDISEGVSGWLRSDVEAWLKRSKRN